MPVHVSVCVCAFTYVPVCACELYMERYVYVCLHCAKGSIWKHDCVFVCAGSRLPPAPSCLEKLTRCIPCLCSQPWCPGPAWVGFFLKSLGRGPQAL